MKALLLILALALPASAQGTFQVVQETEDEDNGTYQVTIEWVVDEEIRDAYSPSLSPDERILYETGSDDDRTLLLAPHIARMKAQWAEANTEPAPPVVTELQPGVAVADADDAFKARIQAGIDALTAQFPADGTLTEEQEAIKSNRDALQEKLDAIP